MNIWEEVFTGKWKQMVCSCRLLVATWTKVNPNATAPWNGNDGVWQRQFYNGLGQLVQSQSPAEDWTALPSPAGTDIVAYTVYDGLGRPVKAAVPYTVPRYVYNGQNPYKSPAGTAFSTTTYDNLGRTLTVTDPGGNVSSTSYAIPTGHTVNGVSALLLTKVTNPNNQLVSYYHDVWGQLLKVRDHTNPTTAYSDTEYDYDLLGNLLAVNTKEPSNDGSGAVLRAVSMSYDHFGRKTGMVDPDMGTWQYRYDPAGHLTAQIANNLTKLCFTYDSFGRPLTKFDDSNNASSPTCPTSPPTAGSSHLATYTYGTSAASYNFGRPVTIQWGDSPSHNQESFTYDSRGRVTSHTRWLDGRAATTTITAFDAQNRPTSLTSPSGETITTTYDWFGENSLTAGADALITSMGYNERGQLTTINRAAAALPDTNYNYYAAAGSGGNESYRLQQIQSGSLLNLNYQYDALGNITQLTDNVMADSQNFTYDHLNRLVTANGSSDYGCTLPCYSHTYAYNKLGNITSAAGQSYSYSDLLHKQAVTSISPNQNFGYDAHGNMTTRTDSTGTYTQSYDVENRLISVNKSGVGTTTFGYDANGQRTTTRTPDGTLTYTPFPGYEQSYPTAKQDTFPVNDANWGVENGGNWSWNSQFYVSNDTTNNALTTLKSATLGSSGVIAASIRANSNENGYLVFDYQDTGNYKYVGLDAQTDRWVFGQRVNSTNSDLYVLNQTVNSNQWYDVKVVLNGNTAKLYVNGAYKAQYNYPTAFTGGKVGLRAVNATTYFDNFLVSAAEISRSTYAIAGQTIATRISGDPVSSNNGLFYIFSDHLGSTSVLATTAGGQVPNSRATYYPFGSPRTTPTQTITDRNFTGQKENMELGLIYYNARYYVPGIARFLTPDTIIPNPTNSQSFNRYTYVLNNPTRFTDPTGHICYDPDTDAAYPGNCNGGNTPVPPPPSSALPPAPKVTPHICNDDFCVPGSVSPSLPYLQGDDNYDHVISSLTWLQHATASGTAWWGKELTVDELLAFVIAVETSGNEKAYGLVHDIMTAKYNLHCGDGPWSASCIQGFWSYSSAMLSLYASSTLQGVILNLANDFDVSTLLRIARIVSNRPGFGTAMAAWGWGNLSAEANSSAFTALSGQIGSLSVYHSETYAKGVMISFFFIITPDQKTAICRIQNVDCSNGLVNAP